MSLRFGIIGTGFISDWFVAACRKAGGSPTAIYSRDADRAAAFAARNGLGVATDSLEQLLTSSAVDAIYVASPIAAHAPHVVDALAHGKHVLCEKTMTTSAGTLKTLYELADRNGCVLLEAIRPAHDPALARIRAALPQLGTLRNAHFEKCQYSSRYPSFLQGEIQNAFDPASGNSALRDIGVYCLHPSLMLFGRPTTFSGYDYRLANGFQAGGSVRLEYEAMSVTCTYSKTVRSVTPSVILGELGSLTIDSIAEPATVVYTDVLGRARTIFEGRPKGPEETLHYPVATFLELCRDGVRNHPYRELSTAAEDIMSGLLHRDRGCNQAATTTRDPGLAAGERTPQPCDPPDSRESTSNTGPHCLTSAAPQKYSQAR